MTAFHNFETAFRGGVSGLRRTCECGIEYWDSYNTDWEDGEREALEQDPNARALNHSVGVVEFEGRYYVDGCTCWHDRAKKIMNWIDNHAVAIADYLTREKRRKQAEADASPVVY